MAIPLPQPLRRAAEILSRNASFRAHLPERYGRRPIIVSPANNLSILRPGEARFDPFLFKLADRFVRRNSVIWDIGANMGVFSLAAAHIASSGNVLAIEPDPFNLQLLNRTRALPTNADLHLDVLPAAVSHEMGTAKLRIPERGRAASSLVGASNGTQMGGVRAEISVNTVTLDWLLTRYPAPDFIKCDAEGAEHWILRGGERLMCEVRPTIIFELTHPNAEICAAILQQREYVAYCAVAEDVAPPLADLSSHTEILAIPRERMRSNVNGSGGESA